MINVKLLNKLCEWSKRILPISKNLEAKLHKMRIKR